MPAAINTPAFPSSKSFSRFFWLCTPSAAARGSAAPNSADTRAIGKAHRKGSVMDRGSIPIATLHYMPPHPRTGLQLHSHGGHVQHQPHQGIIPGQPITANPQAPRSAAPSQQAPQYHATPMETAVPPLGHAAPQPPRNAAPLLQSQQDGPFHVKIP